ncbi:HNH endonuclease [Spirosoma areae]
MIRVHKDFDNPPGGLVSDSCQAQRQQALAEKAKHNFSGYYYRDSTIDALRKIYKYKCGYCETHESAGASLRVDHYRPKAGVKDAPTHTGYYWLAYEWSNLVLSCEKCNRKKWDHFPIQDEANRVLIPTLGADGLPAHDSCRADKITLLNEHPLLLNPEIDDPDQHLTFLRDGTVEAKTANGTKSIELYFLQRDELIKNRKTMTDDVLEKLKKHLLKYLKREIDEETYRYSMQDVYEEAALNRQTDKAYSRVANALFDDFENFVVSQFPTGQQAFIRQSFQLYQQGKLWPLS